MNVSIHKLTCTFVGLPAPQLPAKQPRLRNVQNYKNESSHSSLGLQGISQGHYTFQNCLRRSPSLVVFTGLLGSVWCTTPNDSPSLPDLRMKESCLEFVADEGVCPVGAEFCL